ncbi:MAG: VOC family protein [Clostridiales bacterium]|nr:VOC family protein [Clostridiales bacterium]
MLKVGAIVWGVQDVSRAVEFWSQALDYKTKGSVSEEWAILVPKDGEGVQISLNKVSSPKAKRHHLDLFTDNQKAETERLIALGATRKIWRYPDDADYVVLQDPDGNPFCVVQK